MWVLKNFKSLSVFSVVLKSLNLGRSNLTYDIISSMNLVIPKELLWDYREPPDDLLWRLQRVADFFPAYGTDKETVQLLFENRDKLKLEKGKYNLIGLYKEVWDEKSVKGNR